MRLVRSEILSCGCIILILAFVTLDVKAKAPVKIVGGSYAKIEEFPSLVAIGLSGDGICGGSLISNRHVLTAAHCLLNERLNVNTPAEVMTENEIHVYTGGNNRGQFEKPREVERIHIYKDFNFTAPVSPHDIAILTLKDAIVSGSTRKPIALPTRAAQPDEIGYIAGWGDLNEYGLAAEMLYQTQMKVENCSKFNLFRLDTELCGFIRKGSGPCTGDSGGPLIINDRIAGIIKSSWKCGGSKPAIFTRVFSYIEWIHRIIDFDY
ncbi:chymotrypsin-2-like [Diachasmimorpha longicaudata]|uniref:chymotrypsin-2-like n=1 Tax=Diachasmimorpha longicaudata TaxID=58733 RepID=UPI0030B91510